MFEIGDSVIMSKPVTSCRGQRNTVGIVTGIDVYGTLDIISVDTLGANRWWTVDQFELINPSLENK